MALTALSGGSFLGIAVTFTNTSGPPFLGVHGDCATAYDKLYFDDGGGPSRQISCAAVPQIQQTPYIGYLQRRASAVCTSA